VVAWANEEEFWSQVMRHGLPRFRWFRRPVAVDEVDVALGERPDWIKLRWKVIPGDVIWPFRYPRSRRVWGHHEGFVVLRAGRLVGGVVTISS
jgi:hypothetical protein